MLARRRELKIKLRTCFPARLFGRLGISILLSPTPIAPELTRTTLCPFLFNCIVVSTTEERVDKSGWCVCSWTMEEVPETNRIVKNTVPLTLGWLTEFNDNGTWGPSSRAGHRTEERSQFILSSAIWSSYSPALPYNVQRSVEIVVDDQIRSRRELY